MIAPAEGVVWKMGTDQVIRWQKKGRMSKTVLIQLWRRKEPLMTISDSTENDGSSAWTIPSKGLEPGPDYFILVGTADMAIQATSGYFTIE